MFLFVCVLKNIDHDSVKSFERTENQLFHFPSQLTRKKKNALEQRKFPCIHFLHVTNLMLIFFQKNNIEKQKLLRRRKILYPYHWRKMWKRTSVYSSGFQAGDTTHRICVSGIAWWFVLCCAMGKIDWFEKLIPYCILICLCKNVRNILITPRATLACLPFKSASSKLLIPCSLTHSKKTWWKRCQNSELWMCVHAITILAGYLKGPWHSQLKCLVMSSKLFKPESIRKTWEGLPSFLMHSLVIVREP